MPVKSAQKTVQNREGYQCDNYFHYFQMQKNEERMDLTSKIWGMFVKTLYTICKKFEAKGCSIASRNSFLVNLWV
jgi:hypothetical protein